MNQTSCMALVKPYSPQRELLLLIACCLCIVSTVSLRFYRLAQQPVLIHLQPYQHIDTILTPLQRTLYRNLYASINDIVDLRNQGGWWPEVSLLQQQLVPPFAEELLPRDLHGTVWTSYDGGSWVDYLGYHPQHAITFILRLIDLHAGYHPHPHPGVDYDPNRLTAVQVWYFPEPARPYPGERLPDAGWFWLMQAHDPLLKTQSLKPVSNNSP